MKRIFIPEMTWTEVRDLLPKTQVGIIPTGSTEQHGPHLPLQSDITFCLYLCKKAAVDTYPLALVSPPVAIGLSKHHMKFAGTLSLTPETFINVIYEIAASLQHHGITKVAIINGHGGNQNAIKIAAKTIYDRLNMAAASLSYWDLLPTEVAQKVVETPVPGHSCEFETSLSYVIQPELIRNNAIVDSDHIKLNRYQKLMAKSSIEICSTGVPRGDPRLASREKGEQLIDALGIELSKFLIYYAEYGDRMGKVEKGGRRVKTL